MPTYGREREYFIFCFKTKNISKQQSWTPNQRQAIIFQTDFSFSKAMRKGRIYFPKRKTRSTPICKCTLFFKFSQNISKSNLNYHIFCFEWDISKCIREERTWRAWKLMKPIRKPMSNAQWWYPSLSKKNYFQKEGKRSLLCKYEMKPRS